MQLSQTSELYSIIQENFSSQEFTLKELRKFFLETDSESYKNKWKFFLDTRMRFETRAFTNIRRGVYSIKENYNNTYIYNDFSTYTCKCGKPANTFSSERTDGTQKPLIVDKEPACRECFYQYLDTQSINEGFISYTHKSTIEHYQGLKYYIPVCENHNRVLGFRCGTDNSIYFELTKYLDSNTGKLRKEYWGNKEIANQVKMELISMTVDHIDGNPKNNYINNLMVLCPHCHSKKTNISKDGVSEGSLLRSGSDFKMKFHTPTDITDRSISIFKDRW